MSRMIEIAPRLPVHDFRAARRFYETLGFAVRDEIPDVYATMLRDDIEIHIRATDDGQRASSYIWIEGIDDLADELRRRGITMHGPVDQDHGMREIAVRDPSGNLITFGESR
ncbi:MAG TPA: VOC family protein [Thermoanaerobaculia bacterium]|nr:VOC family protein [Thermoanaerobaculia bacterium]